MDNVVLDVAIGLVFIYLLYSLLATTINEFVAMIFAYRHRMLEKAIEQMLDGKNYSYYWWDKLANIFLWVFDFGKQKRYKKNNIQADSLTTSAFFRNKEINDVSAFEHKNAEKQNRDKNYIRRAKLNKKASLFAGKIINHPQYRRKSEQSILYKKPAYLSASAFSDILFDVLSGRRSEINATPILMSDIKTFVSNQSQINAGLRSILNMYIEQANGDVQKFKLLLEDWFDDSMNRVSGWYKRQATKVLFVIGFVLAITFNVSTIDIVNRLSVNKDLREAMAKSASAYIDNANKNSNNSNSSIGTSQQKNADEKNEPLDTISKNNADANQTKTTEPKNPQPNDTSDAALGRAQQQINNIRSFYKDTLSEINMMMGLGWDSVITYKNFVKAKSKNNDDFVWKVNSDSINWVNKSLQWILPTLIFNSYYKALSVITHALAYPALLLGFLITALAITLGAPFWFDLLNKFVNVRAGGNKPSEDAKDSATSALNQKPAPKSFA